MTWNLADWLPVVAPRLSASLAGEPALPRLSALARRLPGDALAALECHLGSMAAEPGRVDLSVQLVTPDQAVAAAAGLAAASGHTAGTAVDFLNAWAGQGEWRRYAPALWLEFDLGGPAPTRPCGAARAADALGAVGVLGAMGATASSAFADLSKDAQTAVPSCARRGTPGNAPPSTRSRRTWPAGGGEPSAAIERDDSRAELSAAVTETPVPGVCARLAADAPIEWVAGTLLPAMRGGPLGQEHRRRLERCWREIPPPGRPLYVVAMLSRAASAVRIEIGGGLDLAALAAFLRRLGAAEQAARVARLAPVLMDAERLHLSFDLVDPEAPAHCRSPIEHERRGSDSIGGPDHSDGSEGSGGFDGPAASLRTSKGLAASERSAAPDLEQKGSTAAAACPGADGGEGIPGMIGPRVGIEASFPRQPGREARWSQLLARMTEADLCSAEAARAALDWPGRDSVLTAPQAWPTARAVHAALPTSIAPRSSPDHAAPSPSPRRSPDLPGTPDPRALLDPQPLLDLRTLPDPPDDALVASGGKLGDSLIATFQPAGMGGAAPGTCARFLSHVKLVCDGSLSTTAKVYLLYAHLRGRR